MEIDYTPVNSVVNLSHFCDSMRFDKKAFFYILDEGVIEITLNVLSNIKGTWKTIESGQSALANVHYKHVEGHFNNTTSQPTQNKLEVNILSHGFYIKFLSYKDNFYS